ncbi:MAG TPA: mechanosensitive ion channel domain-containing protein [Gammaproteobacteria bacterium]
MPTVARLAARGAALLLASLAASAPAPAQETAPPPAEPAEPVERREPPVMAEEVEQLRDDLEAGQERIAPMLEAVDPSEAQAWLDASPLERLRERLADPALTDEARALWQEALDREQAAAERVRAAVNSATLVASGDQRLQEAERQVQAIGESLARGDAADAERPLSGIEQEIASLQSREAQIGLGLDQRRETLARLEEQLRRQAETLEQLRRVREQELAAADAEEVDDPALAEAQQAARAALDRSTDARIVAAQLDSRTTPPRIELLRLEIRADELQARWIEERLQSLEAEFDRRSTAELRVLSADLQTLIEGDPGITQRLGGPITALRAQIDRIGSTQNRIRALQEDREDYRQIENDLTQTLANVRERLAVGGLTESLGGLFLEEQRRLGAFSDLRFTLGAIERELAQSRLRAISLRESQRENRSASAGGGTVDAGAAELRRIREQVTGALLEGEESLAEQLQQNEARLRAVVALVDELDLLLRETLLWWPSHEPISAEWLMRVPAAVMALLEPESWQATGSAVRRVTLGSPGISFLTLLVVGFVYRSGRRTGRRLWELAEKTRHRFTDNIGLTFKAMGWSLLRILPVPMLLAVLAYRLRQLPETAPGVEILSAVLFSAAVWWLAGHLLVLFISRNGVGTVHFEWNPSSVLRLRRDLPWYLPVQFVLIICLALAFGHPNDVVFDVLGRAALVVAASLTGLLAWRLLAPRAEPEHAAEQDGPAHAMPDRRRRLIRLAAVGYAGALVILAAAGYLLTVSELLRRTIDTAVVAGGVWLLYRLALRALMLSELRVRIRRMHEQREKAAALESTAALGDGAVEVPEPHLSMEDINQQTRTLVRVTAGGLMVIGLFWVWADVLPALSWLDRVTLWSRTVTVAGAEIESSVSLQDLLLAVFLAVLFTMAARNLPGLVEILLTRATRMDGAGRYTVATLLRYAITVVAVVTAFSLLGLRWSELQWMVAALTLGLGFGLQEVVANFVSGLIMLFERPVRVGDTITIGEYSGTVARIRTRATTIIDWDNREIVVPNKTFITERLINWTLSDTMTRIVLPVVVRYETDPELVMRTLSEIAASHPFVLADPAPTVLFTKFGERGLEFELRVYVNQLRERMDTLSDLHRTILAVFRERGIEIAVPQMDLHVREVPPGAVDGARPAAPATSSPLSA